MAAALELARWRQLLLSLALQAEAWRATEAAKPLRGVSVCLTGVMCCAMGSEDTHAMVGGLVRRCGGAVAPSVTKGGANRGGTGLLIVGRGEKVHPNPNPSPNPSTNPSPSPSPKCHLGLFARM